ncbi:hypothetical protein AWB77_06863 [Caballeronia fortuita]|uniref:DUF2889 domain-containing protein n=1 Tax=Caballeronia fortuita TaxID=1777138 RepID=A0A158EA44_9BURK|nr:DUF2889 domain-containing protein [Caballeronia fortuita]SAL03752.1 hypothetical protein AWB77_06863 [Caballeronia fortuita]
MERDLLHTRRIEIHGYKRADGLYDIEGTLTDTKAYDRTSNGVVRRAGEPIHAMKLRITLGKDFLITDAHAEAPSLPYAGHCDDAPPVYAKLIGMTLAPGFMREVRERFGGVKGCTHLTELIGAVATVAFQTMSEELNASNDARPFQLDGCIALRTDGAAVQRFYPAWYRGGAAKVE